ncbi:MAG: FAD-dependent oxidoreductase [Rhodospirillales bacterium]|nr:FAD-dependent oxidoreductase [Rhodospirillales bacterium]MBT7505080.1 FAD-dependent oxidoreductase [Rhodospirillales bacterium]MBT7779381.1 FAD-dependent oxidoreductase [Rhodospirillales bacterium]
MTFPNLFSPIKLGSCEIKNRIVSTGHDTILSTSGLVNDKLIAYHTARAAGGCGLIITQVAAVHHTAYYTPYLLIATNDDFISGYRSVVEACHAHGAKVFGQLFHPGREVSASMDGAPALAYAPSATPSERFRTVPCEMSAHMIEEIISGYGEAAHRMAKAGADGVEIVASHGYLPAQFLSQSLNARTDQYGGSEDNRLRFLKDVIASIRSKVGTGLAIGMRMSIDEKSSGGMTEQEALAAIAAFSDDLDYLSIVAGSSATNQGATHIVPSMEYKHGYTSSLGAQAKEVFSNPVIVTGRINQPQIAESMIHSGEADLCGMTRAMICDPDMPNKAMHSKIDDIRACIGCNQACIGHVKEGVPISCIQHPVAGRELQYGNMEPTTAPKKVLVVGGGPAGMKAASVAASRGHQVTLMEREDRLGGQANKAHLLPGREEFSGIITNLSHEMERAGVHVLCNQAADLDVIDSYAPDEIILACGATPYWPTIEGAEEANIVDAWQVLDGTNKIGASVLVADWTSDWIALGIAEKLAREGCRVRLATTDGCAGEVIPLYIKDSWNSVLLGLGVEIIPYVRLFGADANTAYLERTVNSEHLVIDDVDTIVLAQGHVSNTELVQQLQGRKETVHVIGDCLAPRNAESAVLDGLKIGASI